MTFDWSISLGAVIIAITNVSTIILVAWRLTVRFTNMERKVNLMFGWFLKQITGKADAFTEAEIREFFGLPRIPQE